MEAVWWPNECAYAGAEHLDPEYVAAFDRKSPTDWSEIVAALSPLGIDATSTVIDIGAGTGTFALAVQPHVQRVIAVDASPAMVELMCARGIEAVEGGFLTYEHVGRPADLVHSRHALHHLSDFWKAVALDRVAQMLKPGGTLLLQDIVYSFAPSEAAAVLEQWLADAPADAAQGWTAQELAEHIRGEHSTFSWLLEPILDRAGFEITASRYGDNQIYASYTCRRR